jgi:hypothetical protein
VHRALGALPTTAGSNNEAGKRHRRALERIFFNHPFIERDSAARLSWAYLDTTTIIACERFLTR